MTQLFAGFRRDQVGIEQPAHETGFPGDVQLLGQLGVALQLQRAFQVTQDAVAQHGYFGDACLCQLLKHGGSVGRRIVVALPECGEGCLTIADPVPSPFGWTKHLLVWRFGFREFRLSRMNDACRRIVHQRLGQIAAVGQPVAAAVRPAQHFRDAAVRSDAQTEPVSVVVADHGQRVGQHESRPDDPGIRIHQLLGRQRATEFRTTRKSPVFFVQPDAHVGGQLQGETPFNSC